MEHFLAFISICRENCNTPCKYFQVFMISRKAPESFSTIEGCSGGILDCREKLRRYSRSSRKATVGFPTAEKDRRMFDLRGILRWYLRSSETRNTIDLFPGKCWHPQIPYTFSIGKRSEIRKLWFIFQTLIIA